MHTIDTIHTPDTLASIDASLAALELRKAPILAAIEKADDLALPPPPATRDAEGEQRRSVVAWMLGLADRAAVDKAADAADREAKKRAAHRQAVERERELARLGIEELRKLLAPIEAEADELRERRAAVVAGILDAEVHDAAVAYREAMVAAASAYTRLCALGERAMEAGGSRHLFPAFSQIVGPAPSEGSAAVFGHAALGGFTVHVIKHGAGVPPRGPQEAVVRVDDARRAVNAELAARGLTNL